MTPFHHLAVSFGQSDIGLMVWIFVIAAVVVPSLVYRRWRSHEEAKASRRTFNRIMQANRESVPQAAGYPHRRIS